MKYMTHLVLAEVLLWNCLRLEAEADSFCCYALPEEAASVRPVHDEALVKFSNWSWETSSFKATDGWASHMHMGTQLTGA